MSRTGPPSAADVQAAFCSVLVDEWARAGVTDAVVAPGSRSTPLVAALDADTRLRVHVVLDERSAGFVALGFGLSTGRPAVVATTSGTASVELHPAVVEAHHACVPLVVATADRPPELHHVGAAQTVEQDSLFGAALRWSAAPGVADLESAWAWRSLGSRMAAEASGASGRPGPVHANLAFREPLIGDAAAVDVPAGRDGGAPWHSAVRPVPARADPDVVGALRRYAGGRGLVVAGGGGGDPAGIVRAGSALGWPVVADPRSGCRGRAGGVVAAADALLRVPGIAGSWTPEVVVRCGAPWASKVLSQWLSSLDARVEQVLIDPLSRWSDPERRASRVVTADAGDLLGEVAAGLATSAGRGDWWDRWERAEGVAQETFDRLLGAGGELELSEPAVARAVIGGVPDESCVVVSSSMPVRDVEWFGPAGTGALVMSNRGANGIDGVLSTAVGVACSGRPTAALLGDLAFLYDAGALLWAAGRDMSLTVVVVDNDGGGIFSFLPQATLFGGDSFERYWGTPHGVDLVAVAAAYGVTARPVRTRAELDGVLADVGKPGVRVAVLKSDRAANVAAHERLNSEVAAAVSPVVSAVARPGGG